MPKSFISQPLYTPSQWWAGVNRTLHDDEALRLIWLRELEEIGRRNLIGRDWAIFEQTPLARLRNPKGSSPTNAEIAARHGITPKSLKKIRTRINHTLAAARRKRDAAMETIDIMASFRDLPKLKPEGGVTYRSEGREWLPTTTNYSTSRNTSATAVSSSNTPYRDNSNG